MLHGCLPVVVMDNVDPVFATLLDWPSFSIRIAEARASDASPELGSSHACFQQSWRRKLLLGSCCWHSW